MIFFLATDPRPDRLRGPSDPQPSQQPLAVGDHPPADRRLGRLYRRRDPARPVPAARGAGGEGGGGQEARSGARASRGPRGGRRRRHRREPHRARRRARRSRPLGRGGAPLSRGGRQDSRARTAPRGLKLARACLESGSIAEARRLLEELPRIGLAVARTTAPPCSSPEASRSWARPTAPSPSTPSWASACRAPRRNAARPPC